MRVSAKNTEKDAFSDSGNAECARLLKEGKIILGLCKKLTSESNTYAVYLPAEFVAQCELNLCISLFLLDLFGISSLLYI